MSSVILLDAGLAPLREFQPQVLGLVALLRRARVLSIVRARRPRAACASWACV